VNYGTAFSFRQALDARLLAHSRTKGVPLEWLRKQVAFDRLLARLIAVAPDRWRLKGALALDYRLIERARTSKDMDLAHGVGEAQAVTDLREAAAVDLGDFFVFQVARTSRLDEALAGAAVRFHLDSRVGRNLFNAATVDVGFTDPFDVEPELVSGPRLLEFAGIAPTTVPAVPLVDHVAQKVHACSSRYGRSGQPSSRTKDLADLVIFAETFRFDAAQLRHALVRTFEGRRGFALPQSLPLPPASWRIDYRPVAARLGLDPDVATAHRVAAAFLDPVLQSSVPTGKWDPSVRRWTDQA
jgi:hypothetical protein